MATRRKPHSSGLLLLVSLVLALLSGVAAGAETWPRELHFSGGSIQIFQPEIDAILPNAVEARAALSIRQNHRSEPLFAAIRFKADTASQNHNSLYAENIRVVDIRFSKQDEGEQQQLIALVESSLADITLELDTRRQARADNSYAEDEDFRRIKADPPRIILSGKPAILVFIDGEPRFEKIENSDLRRVANTPFSIIARQSNYYLAASESLWYRANHALGPWISVDNAAYDIPAEVLAVVKRQQNSDQNISGPPAYPRPEIIVATEPTELIIYDGLPSWSPLEGMNLLYMSNTDNDVFLDIESSQNYVLLSGRWYKGRVGASDVPWQPVANDALPGAFQNIEDYLRAPEVMTHIAGTQQSRDALLDNTLPRTRAVDLDESAFTAEWDGNPKFESVRGTNALQYALNTPDAIFKYQNAYYACEDGIWYTSHSPWGGWSIATHIPDIIYDIPASNPHHNVTYVRIYDTTPNRVYVGYTPGYLGSYAYHGSIVYGTGWHYRPWSHKHYYARPATWGFNAFYDEWNGWGYSAGLFGIGYPFAHYSQRNWHHSPGYSFYRHHRNHRSRSGSRGYRRHETVDSNPRHLRVGGNRDHYRNRNGDRNRDWDRDRDRIHGRDNSHERDNNSHDRNDSDRRRGKRRSGNANDDTATWLAKNRVKTPDRRSIKRKPKRAIETRVVSRPTHAFTVPDKSRTRRDTGGRSRFDSRGGSGQHRSNRTPAPEGLRNVDKHKIAKIRDNARKYVERKRKTETPSRNRKTNSDRQNKSEHKPRLVSGKRQERSMHIASRNSNRARGMDRRSRKLR